MWNSLKSECQWHVFIYWVSVTAVLKGSFPNFNLTCKENSVHYSLLIDMFGKAEMGLKRWMFWQAGEDFKMQVTPTWCGWVGIIVRLSRCGYVCMYLIIYYYLDDVRRWQGRNPLNKCSSSQGIVVGDDLSSFSFSNQSSKNLLIRKCFEYQYSRYTFCIYIF